MKNTHSIVTALASAAMLSLTAEAGMAAKATGLDVRFFGHWEHASQRDGRAEGESLRSFHRSDVLVAMFNDSSTVQVYGVLGPTNGYALVSVDAGSPELVDFYAAAKRPHVRVWSQHMRPGPHVVTIAVLGRHRAQSRGNYVNVDAIDTGAAQTLSGARRGVLVAR